MEILDIKKNVPLATLCTLGVGGLASQVITVTSVEEMQKAILHCQKIHSQYFILGKGSNCLFSDEGFCGVIIHNKIDFLETLAPGVFKVGAGYSFSLLGTKTAKGGWGGLEFASGIPATVGGAIFMNAGANGHETCETLVSVEYVDSSGKLHVLKRQDIDFSYRFSSFQKIVGAAIVAAVFKLKESPGARKKQLGIITYRRETQPYSEKSAGCIFKNDIASSAGALIDKSGLKGLCFGGAEVSTLHANFIINRKGATAEDVKQLIASIQKSVKDTQGIDLESEIRIIASK